jgi:hypothetical protein
MLTVTVLMPRLGDGLGREILAPQRSDQGMGRVPYSHQGKAGRQGRE